MSNRKLTHHTQSRLLASASTETPRPEAGRASSAAGRQGPGLGPGLRGADAAAQQRPSGEAAASRAVPAWAGVLSTARGRVGTADGGN